MKITPLDPHSQQAKDLLTLSDDFLASLYPAESIHLASAKELKRGPYGDYASDPLSIFMEKCLKKWTAQLADRSIKSIFYKRNEYEIEYW